MQGCTTICIYRLLIPLACLYLPIPITTIHIQLYSTAPYILLPIPLVPVHYRPYIYRGLKYYLTCTIYTVWTTYNILSTYTLSYLSSSLPLTLNHRCGIAVLLVLVYLCTILVRLLLQILRNIGL